MAPHPMAEQELRPTGRFHPEFRRRAIRVFGSDGAWLLTSVIWYGWRAHYDLACAIGSTEPPELGEDPRPDPLDHEFQIVRDLQIQAALFAVAEQFATLVRAARRHVTGEETFFEAYVGAPVNFASLLDEIRDTSRDEVTRMLGEPTEYRWPVRSPPALRDPASVETVDVGGIQVPRAVLDEHAQRNSVDRASEVVETVLRNIAQLRQFVDEPTALTGVEVRARPLRDIDNAFRHGLRVLFHECVPDTRRFRVGAVLDDAKEFSVDLYMPQRKGAQRIRFGTVSCTPERTTDHLAGLRQLSIRTGQVARGFAGKQLFGDAQWLLAASTLSLPDPPGARRSASGAMT